MSTKDPIAMALGEATTIGNYFKAYVEQIAEVASQIPQENLQKAFDLLTEALSKGKRVYSAGNGGSAAISDHLCCDWMKGTHVPHKPAFKVQSLSANVAIVTAFANDYSYQETFSKQVEMLGEPGDVLVLISSSGNSPNIIHAAEAAKAKGLKVIGLCGFAGGKLATVADVAIHVPANNYGISEDVHQMVMHAIAQFLAKQRM